MESFKNNKGIKVQSVTYPEINVSFNEWAENLNVSSMYEEPLRRCSNHSYSPPLFEVKETFISKCLKMFGITK